MITRRDLEFLVELATVAETYRLKERLAKYLPDHLQNSGTEDTPAYLESMLKKHLDAMVAQIPAWFVSYMDHNGHHCEREFTGARGEEEARQFAKQWQQRVIFYRINGGEQHVVY